MNGETVLLDDNDGDTVTLVDILLAAETVPNED